MNLVLKIPIVALTIDECNEDQSLVKGMRALSKILAI